MTTDKINPGRIRRINNYPPDKGTIIYWMSRDQRVRDNWALLFAKQLADELNRNLVVVFTLIADYPDANLRHYDFMIKGLQMVEKSLLDHNISLIVLRGNPPESLKSFTEINKTGAIVTDFDPLQIKRQWKEHLIKLIKIPVFEVDAHNIVPCWITSQKEEFAAYTIRPKINRNLPEFFTPFPKLTPQKNNPFSGYVNNWSGIMKNLSFQTQVNPVNLFYPGEEEAFKTMNRFFEKKLQYYNEKRNDPNADVSSNLSPYLHFGHISAQRVALETVTGFQKSDNSDSFLEELIIRRELADNFCFYNPNYDNTSGFKPWALKTLGEHMLDEREYTYTLQEFELATTHDDLWNAAQKEMVLTGKMHSYLRMYWAKKILEWSRSVSEALDIANRLNNKYELDGRDPNGYAGCAWSIGGIHDRAWAERPVYGKIRYMNKNGCKRKFDVNGYIKRVNQIQD